MNKLMNESSNPYRAVISGCGSFVPEKLLTNDDLAKMVDTSDEWITSRTGIKVRHIADESETTAILATKAAKKALDDSNLDPADLELLILATVTPEMVFPATSCFVQSAIGANKACVFDLHAACSGFIYSLGIVQQFLESGFYNNALVIGAETLTKITNWQDRASCILFGDGAGAVVFERKNNGSGILYSTMSADGDNWAALNCQAYGSRHPPDKKLEDPNKIYMEIKGRQVYQQAIRRIVETVTDCLKYCDLTLDDIKMLISHQMNGRIIESAAKRLNLPEEKVFINIAEYGNTSAASVPIAFDDCVKKGKVKQGDIIILVAFGAGLTWGANVIRL
ncbi:MAG: beta-ketoacyl-ACP synthase III [Phycisphaerae bacterium]|nr:ketoacyl-ACP synthase III [Phycisphaerae bacterium]NIR67000.1 ketoacyl-ACP synthase III [candidate division Zixibacteria bacterium]NIP54243.1 ketoacyl-ACP synthase III [Phycisphaerae bacterium]NIS50969.1 ketoacyl-ACP synthase III [Phycisphaerae bacterium]NIU08628.1 ketoacyl-ACP synthase III [Phycisphaerae bacterium]